MVFICFWVEALIVVLATLNCICAAGLVSVWLDGVVVLPGECEHRLRCEAVVAGYLAGDRFTPRVDKLWGVTVPPLHFEVLWEFQFLQWPG